MKMIMFKSFAALCLISFASCGVETVGAYSAHDRAPLEDTEANRIAEADRYLESAEIKKMMSDMSESMSSMLPPGEVENFKEMMTEHLDYEKLKDIMRDSVIKNFTAEETRALADFYESPLGKSVMAKMGPYMEDCMPEIMEMMMGTFQEFEANKD